MDANTCTNNKQNNLYIIKKEDIGKQISIDSNLLNNNIYKINLCELGISNQDIKNSVSGYFTWPDGIIKINTKEGIVTLNTHNSTIIPKLNWFDGELSDDAIPGIKSKINGITYYSHQCEGKCIAVKLDGKKLPSIYNFDLRNFYNNKASTARLTEEDQPYGKFIPGTTKFNLEPLGISPENMTSSISGYFTSSDTIINIQTKRTPITIIFEKRINPSLKWFKDSNSTDFIKGSVETIKEVNYYNLHCDGICETININGKKMPSIFTITETKTNVKIDSVDAFIFNLKNTDLTKDHPRIITHIDDQNTQVNFFFPEINQEEDQPIYIININQNLDPTDDYFIFG